MLNVEKPPFSFPCIIGAEPVFREERIAVRYPYTGEVIGSVPLLGTDDVVRALELSAKTTSTLSRHERSQILLRAAARVEREAEAIARLITWESGLCVRDTRAEVSRTLDVLRFGAGEALRDDGECV